MKKTKTISRKRARMTGYRSTRENAFCRLERLESRAMLAADISPWHNAALPGDIDGDGQVTMVDVELLMGELKATGVRSLGGASQAMGGMEGESPLYLDVTNDGMISGDDLTQLANMLLIEGEDSESPDLLARPAADIYQVGFTFQILNASGDNLLASEGGTANLNLGDVFTFQVMVQNTSPDPDDVSGILSAFIDIDYDPSKVTVVDPNGEQLGDDFRSDLLTPGGIPNNIVPGDSTGQGIDGQLRAMGGVAKFLVEPGADGSAVKLFSLQFQVIGAGDFDFVPSATVRPDDYLLENPDEPGEFYTQFSIEQSFTDGNPAGQNLTATTFVEIGDPAGDTRDIANFAATGIVSISISDEPVFGANPDSYQVGQDFDETLVDEDSDREVPTVVTIDGVQYAVLDVLANDGDEDGNVIGPPNNRFTITGIDTSINNDLVGAEALEDRLEIVFISEHPELQDEGFSHQVILYQVPEGQGGLELFEYTIADSELGDLERDRTVVSITINAAPELIALDESFIRDQGFVLEFDVMTLATFLGEAEEGEELTFDGFVGTDDLVGEFVDLSEEEGYGPGWFRYTFPNMASLEEFDYLVSAGGLEASGTISLETLSNTLIQGLVYFDVNNDGMWNDNAHNEASPERAIGGVAIELWQDGVMVDETETEADGSYRFSQMDPGTYSVRVSDPRFLIKGKNSDGLFEDTISDIVLEEGVSEQALGVSFGYRGREIPYRGFGDFLSSNTEDSIIFAMSKNGGETSMEWYSVDRGWDRLVSIRPDLVFYDAAGGFGQIAFEVSVEGQDDPVLVVHTFSTSSPDFMVLAETNEGVIFRFSGAAMDVLSNLAAIDEAYVDY